MFLHRIPLSPGAIERLDDTVCISVPEKWNRVSVGAAGVDDAVDVALVGATGPGLEKVADVDHVGVLLGRDIDPLILVHALFQHLKPRVSVLQQEGESAEISVSTGTDKIGICQRRVGRVMEQSDGGDGIFAKVREDARVEIGKPTKQNTRDVE